MKHRWLVRIHFFITADFPILPISVVKTTVLLADMNDFVSVNNVYKKCERQLLLFLFSHTLNCFLFAHFYNFQFSPTTIQLERRTKWLACLRYDIVHCCSKICIEIFWFLPFNNLAQCSRGNRKHCCDWQYNWKEAVSRFRYLANHKNRIYWIICILFSTN